MIQNHHDLIRDQFTRQAVPFSTAHTIANADALRLLIECAGAGPQDTVLDVGCGGGLVVCAFAEMVRHATGIDLTPAMLEYARRLATQKNLTNVTWQQGDVLPLPYPDASFTIVTARYTFHHFPDPLGVLQEMRRVCAPGGRILVADTDASADPTKAATFNAMERLRDPSHVRAMPATELKALFHASHLPEPRMTSYALRDELDNLLQRSFPHSGDAATIRDMFTASLEDDRLGIPLRRDGQALHYEYPIALLVVERP